MLILVASQPNSIIILIVFDIFPPNVFPSFIQSYIYGIILPKSEKEKMISSTLSTRSQLN